MTLAATDFVNIHGQKVNTTARVKLAKRESSAGEDYHKGWRVVGVSPEAVTAARVAREKEISEATAHNEQWEGNAAFRASVRGSRGRLTVPDALDIDAWIEKAPLKPARTKPFEIFDAAQQCFEMAVKAGWHRVEVRRLAKGKGLQ